MNNQPILGKIEEALAPSVPVPDTGDLELPQVYYDGHRFHIPKRDGGFVPTDRRGTRDYLISLGFSGRRGEGKGQAVADALLVRIQTEHHVAYVGALAGYHAGLRVMNGRQILVTDSPKFVKPQPGDFPLLLAVLTNLLGNEQLLYLYSWLKVALDTFSSGHWQPHQVLALFGPVGAGKNLLRQIITAILGGRVARPHNFMSGRTAFNLDVFGAETLAIEDEQGKTDIRSRREFAQRIKDIAVNQDQRCEAKHCDAGMLVPLWRMIISGNDDPERLLVMPPLDDDVADKIMLFKVTKHRMPMSTSSPSERAAFWAAIEKELPMLVHFITSWNVPADLRSDRYGVTHYHNPELAKQLAKSLPELSLLEMINVELFGRSDRALWTGSAMELEGLLQGQDSCCRVQATKLLTSSQTTGRYLGRLAKDMPERVTSKERTGQTIWIIRRAADEASALADNPLRPGPSRHLKQIMDKLKDEGASKHGRKLR
ncbi:MAG TPA: hypothetical protein VGW57_07565 [Chthoniobacterales bacterium]|nr:hypothetical protein [Chthoniobacterales bacterium]